MNTSVRRAVWLFALSIAAIAGAADYRNPILYADYSDPDVLRVGSDFYLVASSFSAVPGLPILHSKDLVNWRLVGSAARFTSKTFLTNFWPVRLSKVTSASMPGRT